MESEIGQSSINGDREKLESTILWENYKAFIYKKKFSAKVQQYIYQHKFLQKFR